MPLFISDYEGDTAHLTIEEDGIYNRLLRLCWRTPGCSVPDDAKWIARKMRVTDEYYAENVVPLIEEFFQIKSARVFSSRQQEIFEEYNDKHQRRVDAGKKGGRPRKSLKSNKTGETKASENEKLCESNQNQNQNHTTLSKDKAVSRERVSAASLSEEVEEIAGADSSKSQWWATTAIPTAEAWLEMAKAQNVGPDRARELILAKAKEIRGRDPSQQISRPSFFNRAIEDVLRREAMDRPAGGYANTYGKPRLEEPA